MLLADFISSASTLIFLPFLLVISTLPSASVFNFLPLSSIILPSLSTSRPASVTALSVADIVGVVAVVSSTSTAEVVFKAVSAVADS